jgi:hypothetical protein
LNRSSACDGANRKEEVKSQLAKAGAQILKRPNVGDREVLAIEGIKQPSLRQTIAYFDAQKNLVEVELQYGDSHGPSMPYKAFVGSVTQRLQGPTMVSRPWLKGYMPLNIVAFLDQCARLILLKKVGGGYIFIHRMLLDYFAELTPESIRTTDSK